MESKKAGLDKVSRIQEKLGLGFVGYQVAAAEVI
jgi:hypothetical protein